MLPVKVILDSNFLMIPFQFKIDVFQEIEYLLQRKVDFVVPSLVKAELTNISARGGEGAPEASLALQLASRFRVVEVTLGKNETVDDAIIKAAQRLNALVATTDIELKKRLRNPPTTSANGTPLHSIPVIFMRDKSKLEIDGLDREYI
jgi:hypothetical protein